MSELTERARYFALNAHRGQHRLNGAQTPMVEHLEDVASGPPPVHWNKQKCLDYTEGARKVVFECHGVSDFLFKKFCEAHWAAIKVHRR